MLQKYSVTHKIFQADAICILICSPQLYYAANPYSLALQKVVEVSAQEEGIQHSENVMGCTVSVTAAI